MIDILTSGYVSMDHMIKIMSPAKVGFTSLVENKSNTQIFYGGCSVNIAYALCKLGKVAMPIIRVGEDYKENGFYQFLKEANVPMDGITVVSNEITSTCYLIQDNENNHITIFYPGAMDKKYARPIPEHFFLQAKMGVITVASKEDNQDFFNQCKKNNIPIAFGMKDDMEAFPKQFLKEILEESSLIFMNETEKNTIVSMYDFQNITDLFLYGKVKILVVTLGKNGSQCYVKEKDEIHCVKVPSYPVESIVDATGAGDAYISGFLYGYLQGYHAEKCCKMGGVLSAFVLQKEGCCSNLPDERQFLDEFEKMERGYL